MPSKVLRYNPSAEDGIFRNKMFIKFPGRDLNGFFGFLKGELVVRWSSGVGIDMMVRLHIQLLAGLRRVGGDGADGPLQLLHSPESQRETGGGLRQLLVQRFHLPQRRLSEGI